MCVIFVTAVPVNITIGFDQEIIRVNEGDSRVTVTVSVQNGVVTEPVYVAVLADPGRPQNTAQSNNHCEFICIMLYVCIVLDTWKIVGTAQMCC